MIALLAALATSVKFGDRQGHKRALADSASIGAREHTKIAAEKVNYTQLALTLAELEPKEGLRKLKTQDPFQIAGVRSAEDLKHKFHCKVVEPAMTERPNVMQMKGSFVFYQHMQKAGGTSFCEIARKQMGSDESQSGCRGPLIANQTTLDKIWATAKGNRIKCKSDAFDDIAFRQCLKDTPAVSRIAETLSLKSMQMKNIPKSYIPEQRTPAKFLEAARAQGVRIYSSEFDPFPTNLAEEKNVALVTMLRDPDQLLVSGCLCQYGSTWTITWRC